MLTQVKATEGARKERKRLGRGIASGTGKTAGKGHKGQKARAGRQPRPGFEGGQTPFFQRIPKRGFSNVNRVEYAVINVGDLNVFEEGTEITPELLLETRLVTKLLNGVKVLANGTLEKKLTVKAHKFSKAAVEAIEKNGGTVEVI